MCTTGKRRTLVVLITDIILACHLAPKFSLLDPELQLTAQLDLLNISKNFFLNHYYNHHFYLLMNHWRRRITFLDRLRKLVH